MPRKVQQFPFFFTEFSEPDGKESPTLNFLSCTCLLCNNRQIRKGTRVRNDWPYIEVYTPEGKDFTNVLVIVIKALFRQHSDRITSSS